MKPFRGYLHHWSIIQHSDGERSVFGKPEGHPSFVNWIRTSRVKYLRRDVLVTENSTYILIGEEQPLPDFAQFLPKNKIGEQSDAQSSKDKTRRPGQD